MFRLAVLAGACAALAACGVTASDDSDPVAVCTSMLAGDPEVIEDLAEENDTIDGYCGCFATVLASKSEDDQIAILKVSQIISDIREENNTGIEDAAELVIRDTSMAEMNDGTTPSTYGVSEAEFMATGEFIDAVRQELKSETGACAAG